MRTVAFYPAGRLGISENTRWNIYLVGCGGTGSYIAHALAQLKASQPPGGGAVGRVILVDPDWVEERNIGRQNFAPGDIGHPKVQALAFRYNLAFGLDFEWVIEPFRPGLLPKETSSLSRLLVVGAVDTGEARRTIATALKERHDDVVWLDAGNGLDRGQVVIGNAFRRAMLSHSVDPEINIARYLPYPSLALPELLQSDPRPEPSCAEAAQVDLQGLFVNLFMAGIVGEYLHRLLRGELTVSQTWIHLRPMEMVSVPMNQHNIDRYSTLRSARMQSAGDLFEPPETVEAEAIPLAASPALEE
jgi:PRTRC genetic system ThiF family protein